MVMWGKSSFTESESEASSTEESTSEESESDDSDELVHSQSRKQKVVVYDSTGQCLIAAYP